MTRQDKTGPDRTRQDKTGHDITGQAIIKPLERLETTPPSRVQLTLTSVPILSLLARNTPGCQESHCRIIRAAEDCRLMTSVQLPSQVRARLN